MQLQRLDYYTALEISPTADAHTIEAAYRFCLETYGEDAVATYGLISDDERRQAIAYFDEARRVLGDTELRLAYNRKLLAAGRYSAAELELTAPTTRIEESEGVPSDDFDTGAVRDAQSASPAADSPVDLLLVDSPPMEAKEATPSLSEQEQAVAGDSLLPETAGDPFLSLQEQPEEQVPLNSPQAVPEIRADSPPVLQQPAKADIPELDGRPLGGEELRRIRESLGLTVEEVGERTKISNNNIRYLEQSKYGYLPAPVYVRGFLRTYARLLGINGDKLVADYMPAYEAAHTGG